MPLRRIAISAAGKVSSRADSSTKQWLRALAAGLFGAAFALTSTTVRALPPQTGGTGSDAASLQWCLQRIVGHLSVSPTSVDRATSLYRTVTLTWSIARPSTCRIQAFLGPSLAQSGLSGTYTAVVSKTTTFALYASLGNVLHQVATATATVSGDPGLIAISTGPVTADEVNKFYMQWMQPYDVAQAENAAKGFLLWRDESGVWYTTPRMIALARMYEITKDTRYLDQLRDFIEIALQYRDDNYPGNPNPACWNCGAKPIDQFRGKNEPAWGGTSVNSGGFNRVDEAASSLYAYPIAAFARIVSENHGLQARYGYDALRYTNAVIQTMWVFVPQMKYKAVGNLFEGYLSELDIYKTKLGTQPCQAAFDHEKAAEGGTSIDAGALARLKQMQTNCNNLKKAAGAPLAYNENQIYMMMLIELWRANSSDFYQHSSVRSNDAEPARVLIPVLVARQQRYFSDRLETRHAANGTPYFFWHYEDDVPAGFSHDAEDTSHGSYDVQYIEELRQAFQRLNVPAAARDEPIPFGETYLMRFANTFLFRMQVGSNLADNIDGRPANPADSADSLCDGWVGLVSGATQIFPICRGLSLRVVNGTQPYLSISNHSALLAAKWIFGPPQVGDSPTHVFKP